MHALVKYRGSLQLHLNPNEPSYDITNKMTVHPANEIRLGICPGPRDAVEQIRRIWVAKDPRFLHGDSEDSDQTWQMPRLIRVFAVRTLILLVLSCGPNKERSGDGWYLILFNKRRFLFRQMNTRSIFMSGGWCSQEWKKKTVFMGGIKCFLHWKLNLGPNAYPKGCIIINGIKFDLLTCFMAQSTLVWSSWVWSVNLLALWASLDHY